MTMYLCWPSILSQQRGDRSRTFYLDMDSCPERPTFSCEGTAHANRLSSANRSASAYSEVFLRTRQKAEMGIVALFCFVCVFLWNCYCFNFVKSSSRKYISISYTEQLK